MAKMSEALLTSLITGGLMLIGNIIVAYYQNSKTIYRIEQLEKNKTVIIIYEIDEMKGDK